jgi:hypothetical protein
MDVKPDFLAQNLAGSYGYFSLLSVLGNSMTMSSGLLRMVDTCCKPDVSENYGLY